MNCPFVAELPAIPEFAIEVIAELFHDDHVDACDIDPELIEWADAMIQAYLERQIQKDWTPLIRRKRREEAVGIARDLFVTMVHGVDDEA